MQIRIVPYELVANDIEATHAAESAHDAEYKQAFNTCFHGLHEIEPLIPNTNIFQHASPPLGPYAYTLYLLLLAESQNLQDYHIIQIPTFLLEDLMLCHSSWVNTSNISDELLDDVAEAWLSCKSGRELEKCFDGKKEWFIRLDQNSPKDSPLVRGSVRSLQEVIKKLCSSMRAYGSLHREVDEATQAGREVKVNMVLNPWNKNMDPGYEFRVFVPPPAARGPKTPKNSFIKDFKIAAISQYRWSKPFYTRRDWNMTDEQLAERVYCEAQDILTAILHFAADTLDIQTLADLYKHGFTFDVSLQDASMVQLIEINPFGALSGCGGCLYNWIHDARLLYGLENEVVFAITQESNDDGPVCCC
ncbi:hypothetical protein BDV96DRAFT_644004 [Lophiotrema nucula]|uniref:Cell division cycle protein 123 n=1 Tax=Lophiotrema nucula TaxID=690887 RepID=A0A6A5ZFD8_9PLEO|nr:hypothetical protein BDV96DRAFT_644004 [Lophiotrema nucula]